MKESTLKISFAEINLINLLHNKLNKFSKADFQTDIDISKKTSANISMNKKDLVQ